MREETTATHSANTPRIGGRRGRAGWIALLLLAGAAAGAEEETGGRGTTFPRVLDALRAANDARSTMERERETWRDERSRLALLLETVKEEAVRLDAEAGKVENESDGLRRALGALDANRERWARLRELAGELAARLDAALDRYAERSLPGVVSAETLPGGATEAERFDAAVRRLRETEAAAGAWNAEIVSGFLGETEIAVRLLRAGDALAWWLSLDGARGGTARRREGRLLLVETRESSALGAIRAALGIFWERGTPERVPLPLDAAVRLEKTPSP